MPTIVIPPPYRGPTRGVDEVEVGAGTVRECIEAVETRYPGFREQIVDGADNPHRFVKLFLNGDQLDGDVLAAKVGDQDRLEVLAAIAGG
ncbi:MAG: MoaD/ThiS family protein [Myxococcota bacterium]|nr:MoaD/ThiS family protein [Myxococcota bacterium]